MPGGYRGAWQRLGVNCRLFPDAFFDRDRPTLSAGSEGVVICGKRRGTLYTRDGIVGICTAALWTNHNGKPSFRRHYVVCSLKIKQRVRARY
jgi:hypothetical protein